MNRTLLAVMVFAACGHGSNEGPNDGAEDTASADAALPPTYMDASIDGPLMLPAGAPPEGFCRDGWCWVSPLPQGNSIEEIWGSSSTDVWAVADHGTIMHYDGGQWTRYAPAGGVTWGAATHGWVYGAAANDVWVIAASRLLHWDGASWSAPTTTISNPNALGGTSGTNVLVYDFASANIQAWDGANWTTRALPGSNWRPITFGGDAAATIAVSTTGSIAKWLGSAWGIVDAGTHAANAALVLDSTHVVVAQDSAVSFWDGSMWTTHNPPVAANWATIAGRSFDDIWVSASFARYHWDGASWTAAAIGADDTGEIAAIWEDPTGKPWAGYSDSEVRRYSGTSWDLLTAGLPNIALAYGTSESDIFVVTNKNVPSHWNGTAWTQTSFPAGYVIRDIWGAGPDDYWIGAGKSDGPDADCIMIHWDGTSWTPSNPLRSQPDNDGLGDHSCILAVWGSSSTDVYATSAYYTFHFDGTSWSNLGAVAGGTDIFGTSATDVNILNGTNLFHWNGSTWSTKTMPASPRSGWENSPTDIWFDNYWFDGSAFVQIDTNNSSFGVPVGSTGDMFTFSGTNMRHWTGDGTTTPSSTSGYFVAVSGWRATSGRTYAVTGRGLVVH